MREWKKMHDSMKGNVGAENVYLTNWFAYENLLFLLDNMDSGVSITESQDTVIPFICKYNILTTYLGINFLSRSI